MPDILVLGIGYLEVGLLMSCTGGGSLVERIAAGRARDGVGGRWFFRKGSKRAFIYLTWADNYVHNYSVIVGVN